MPLRQMLIDAAHCQQLVTDQAEGWASATALRWWRWHWTAEDIRIVIALNYSNINIGK